jgi:predicted ATP-grasp superfamily ATP-dependent carboligase
MMCDRKAIVACFDVVGPPLVSLRYGFKKPFLLQKRMKAFPIATPETCLLGNIFENKNKEEKILPVTPAANDDHS